MISFHDDANADLRLAEVLSLHAHGTKHSSRWSAFQTVSDPLLRGFIYPSIRHGGKPTPLALVAGGALIRMYLHHRRSLHVTPIPMYSTSEYRSWTALCSRADQQMATVQSSGVQRTLVSRPRRPRLLEPDRGYQVFGYNHRGTLGSERPKDLEKPGSTTMSPMPMRY